MESFYKTIEPEVVRGAKINVILANIATNENLIADETEVDGELQYIRQTYQLTEEQFNEFATRNREDVKFEITKAHAVKFVVENNN